MSKRMFLPRMEVREIAGVSRWVEPVDATGHDEEQILKSRVIYVDSPEPGDEWEEYEMCSPIEHLTNATTQKTVWLRKRPRKGEAMSKETEFLHTHCSKLRESGSNLAEAAIRVIRDYDGTHRLALAVAYWMQTIADENGRNNKHD